MPGVIFELSREEISLKQQSSQMSGSKRVPEASYSRQQKPHGAGDQRYLRITYGHIVCVVPIINSRGKFVFLINPFVGITLNFSEFISVWTNFLLCS